MLQAVCDNLKLAKRRIAELGKAESDFYITEDLSMDYISTITTVDGEIIYNNPKFWTSTVYEKGILDNYADHTVLDYEGHPVSKERFLTELNSNITRISAIDGEPGEMLYNKKVGDEFIQLVRTDFKHTPLSEYNALNFADDMSDVSAMVIMGCPREASWVLMATGPNEFMTEERKEKFIKMLEAYDASNYDGVVESPITVDGVPLEELDNGTGNG